MKRVFLSLPMSGRTDEDVANQINQMKKWILESKYFGDEAVVFVHNLGCNPNDFAVVDSYKEHGIFYGYVEAEVRNQSLLYLGQAIKQMAYVDYAFFGNGWTKARGCIIERNVAIHYSIPIANCSSLEYLKDLKQRIDSYKESKND